MFQVFLVVKFVLNNVFRCIDIFYFLFIYFSFSFVSFLILFVFYFI